MSVLPANNKTQTKAMVDSYQIAVRFAQALDSEDYTTVASLLGDTCSYACRGALHCDPSAIIASYQGYGETAKLFDSIQYESQVVAESEEKFRIHFSDHIAHADQTFTFRCEQLIEIDDIGRITSIEHIDLPGQVEALAEFKKAVQ